MSEQVLLDNDVALKVACYSLVGETVAVTSKDGKSAAMLGVGRFVIQGRLERASNIANADRAKASFLQLLEAVLLLEPDQEELALAADLEAEAYRLNLELDGGESQLLAILARRGYGRLITGDKRAIAAMAVVAPALAARRIFCLEQLIAQLVKEFGAGVIRAAICAEPQADRALTACMACARETVGETEVMEGLGSYIGHLARLAPGILLEEFFPGVVSGEAG